MTRRIQQPWQGGQGFGGGGFNQQQQAPQMQEAPISMLEERIRAYEEILQSVADRYGITLEQLADEMAEEDDGQYDPVPMMDEEDEYDEEDDEEEADEEYPRYFYPRPGFRDNIRDDLTQRAYQQNMAFHVDDPITGRARHLYQCASCGNSTLDPDIGHIVDWRRYADEHDAQDRGEVIDYYNDLDNLQFECPGCNRSHDFEHDVDGEFLD